MSPNGDDEFFCDGISEEIINALAKIEQLKVTSRTSSFYYKHHKATIPEIGQQLHVNTILEGSVRISGKTIRISAQLINVEEDSHFWSEIWERNLDNIFEIQDEISLLIADKLREQFGHLEIADHLVVKTTSNLAAYESILQGKFHFNKWNPEDVNVSISFFEQALNRDPGLIDAHLGLADAYSFMATAGFSPRQKSWDKVSEHIQTAQSIDPNHAGVNYIMANHAFFTDADFGSAASYIQRSIANKPTYPEAQQFMSFLHMLSGNMEKAKKHLQYAISIDPLNQEALFYRAYFHYRSHQYETTLGLTKDLLEENPKNVPAIVVHAYALLKSDSSAEVLSFLSNTPDNLIMEDERIGLKCLAFILKKDKKMADSVLAELRARANKDTSFQAHAYLFLAYVNLGEFDQAFEMLDKLSLQKSSILLLSFSDPLAENLKSDPRYKQFHQNIYPSIVPIAEQKRVKKPIIIDLATAQAHSEKLLQYMQKESPYLNPSLTLRSLASQIEINSNHLSLVLNDHMGKNFNEFINQYRVEHFKTLAKDQSNSHLSIMGLAFESGFNSKTVFNTFFKKEVGMTPSAYQKKQAQSN